MYIQNFPQKEQLVTATPPSQGWPSNLFQNVRRRRRAATQTENWPCHRHLQPFKTKTVSLGAGVPDWTRILKDRPHQAKKQVTHKGAVGTLPGQALQDKCLVVHTVQDVVNVSRPSERFSHCDTKMSCHFTKLNVRFAQMNVLCRLLFSMSPTKYSATATKSKMATPRFKKSFW